MEKAFDFLRENKDVAFGTVENNRPKVLQPQLVHNKNNDYLIGSIIGLKIVG